MSLNQSTWSVHIRHTHSKQNHKSFWYPQLNRQETKISEFRPNCWLSCRCFSLHPIAKSSTRYFTFHYTWSISLIAQRLFRASEDKLLSELFPTCVEFMLMKMWNSIKHCICIICGREMCMNSRKCLQHKQIRYE